MKTIVATLKSATPYSQSRAHGTEKLDREQPDDYEKRTWRERLHVDDKGEVYIPPMAFKNALQEAAKYLNVKIPGQRNATYTKKFEAGTMVMDPLPLGVQKDDVDPEWLFVPSDGKPGGGTRVWKCFPRINEWSGDVLFYVLDDIINEDIFRRVLVGAGQFIGIGRFRPRNRGFYGRFSVESLRWDA